MNGFIYIHKNTINGKCYVGQTLQKNPKKRWNHGEGYKHSPKLYNAILKYGFDDGFEHIILPTVYCYQDSLNAAEIAMILKLNSIKKGYNVMSGGSNGTPGDETRKKLSKAAKNRSPETRKKMSEARKNPSAETRKKMSETAKNISAETREKMRVAQKLRGQRSEETRKKISEAAKNRSPETLKKMSDAAKNRAPASAETRKKLSEAGKRRKVSSETLKKNI